MNGASKQRLRFHPIDAAGAAACVILSVLTYAVVISPYRTAMKEHQGREQIRMQRSMDAGSRADAARAVAARLDDLRRQLTEYPVVLESPSAVNARVSVLSDLATQRGLDIDMLAVQGARPGTEYTIVPIQMKGTADFPAILSFMHDLSESMPNTGIASFALKSARANANAVSVDLDLVWYARHDNDTRISAVSP